MDQKYQGDNSHYGKKKFGISRKKAPPRQSTVGHVGHLGTSLFSFSEIDHFSGGGNNSAKKTRVPTTTFDV
jgi:hypothetical protein